MTYPLQGLLEGFVTQCSHEWERIFISHLVSDSRQVQPGDCFFAYKGSAQDGRHYIKEAIEKGAAAVVYDPAGLDLSCLPVCSVPLIPIKELAHQVGFIASRFYGHPTQGKLVIGVTGTNGKTSVSHFLAQALAELGSPWALLGTVGNGFFNALSPAPLTTMDAITLQRQCSEYAREGAQGFVLEVSSHALEQGRVAGMHFSHGVFTNLTQDHLDYHGDMEKYGEAKKSLFSYPDLQYAILNNDDPFSESILAVLPEKVKPILFTFKEAIKDYLIVKGSHVENHPLYTRGKVQSPWGEGDLKTQLLGTFNFSNCLAAIGVLGTLGYEWMDILRAISHVTPVKGRMEPYGGGNYPTVIVDFAHTPDALYQALATLRFHCRGKLWVIFGCGGERDRSKRCKMGHVAQQWCDFIVLTMDNPRREDPKTILEDILQGIETAKTPTEVILNRAMAIEKTIEKADVEDWILIAGKGHENYQYLGDKRIYFSDQEVVQNYLSVDKHIKRS